MKGTTRFLVAVLLLLTASISQPVSKNAVGTDTSLISASTTTVGNNIDQNILNRIPVSRDANGLLKLSPGVVHETNVPTDSRITATSQFIDNSELQVLIRVDGVSPTNTPPTLQICDLKEFEVLCAPKGNVPLSLSPAVQYGGNATSGVINIVTKSGGMEFSQGRAFNPNLSKFKSAKFPFYNSPEKDFPLGAISSAGVSGDGSASFQIINFPGNSYFFFRQNNAQFRPIGQFTKISLGNVGFVSSGTLSNRIDNLTGPDFRLFGYRQYFGVGTSNLRSQVKLDVYNADTWVRIGPSFNYTPIIRSRFPTEEQSQSVEIEPGGAFLAFTKYLGSINRNVGYVRGISSTGAPQKQKLFTPLADMRNTVYGIKSLDIIQVTPDVSPE